MSSSDEDGFGGLFGADEPEPEYPVETVIIDRLTLLQEGSPYPGFTPLLNRFDTVDGTVTGDAAAIAALEQHIIARTIEKRGGAVSNTEEDGPLRRPLTVHYRNKRHSLWGHKLWNAAKYLTKRMDEGLIDVYGKSVLELGAGLGVPTLAAFKNGAKVAVVTDYPDADLLDMIQLNVEVNCSSAADMDADVRARYEADYLKKLQQQQRFSATSGVPQEPKGSLTEEERAQASKTLCVTEPLLWGKQEHIKKAMSYTPGGAGFDIVILSDIMFNHVCNDDLCDTLAQTLTKTPEAAGYCVFSHHRAHMELKDYEFFDKCIARGMQYEQIDQQDYDLMFPEDRGPVEVRKPVKCYRITHRFDAAGPALDIMTQRRFDVVIQGTGLAQSFLSAALSRSGLKVLHCDGKDMYGGHVTTVELGQLREYLEEKKMPSCAGRNTDNAAVVVLDKSADLSANDKRRFLVDILPTLYMSNGAVIKQLVQSDMIRTLEFHHVARLLFATAALSSSSSSPSSRSSCEVVEVPLTRSGIFTTKAVGLLEKRRMMEFVRHVEATIAEQHHAKTANPSDSAAYQEEKSATHEAQAVAQLLDEAKQCNAYALSELLERKYMLSGAALDVLTLMRQLEEVRASGNSSDGDGTGESTEDAETRKALIRSVDLLRTLLISVGAYGGRTPFLVPAYGAGELPQSLCRTSAVWGGTFVLRRAVCGIMMDVEKDKQYAVLSNGQQVEAPVVVVPQEVASVLEVQLADWQSVLRREEDRASGALARAREAMWKANIVSFTTTTNSNSDSSSSEMSAAQKKTVQLARVVVVASTPLFSWQGLASSGVTVDTEADFTDAAPVIQAFVRIPPTTTTTASASASASVAAERVAHVTQLTQACEEAPNASGVVLHFTTDASRVSREELQAFVLAHFCSTVDTTEKLSATPSGALFKLDMEKDVIFFASFTISGLQTALDSLMRNPVDIPSETRKTNEFALSESRKFQEATEQEKRHLVARYSRPHDAGMEEEKQEAEENEKQQPAPCLVSVPTLLGNLLDGAQYVEAAREAYEKVIDRLGVEDRSKFVFLARLPSQR